MKNRMKFPFPARGTSRVIHVRGPISAMRDLIAVQQNEKARERLIDFRDSGGFHMPRPDILYWLRSCAETCKVYVPKGTLV
jgi:hypothetical protein